MDLNSKNDVGVVSLSLSKSPMPSMESGSSELSLLLLFDLAGSSKSESDSKGCSIFLFRKLDFWEVCGFGRLTSPSEITAFLVDCFVDSLTRPWRFYVNILMDAFSVLTRTLMEHTAAGALDFLVGGPRGGPNFMDTTGVFFPFTESSSESGQNNKDQYY